MKPYIPGIWQPVYRSHCYSNAAEKIRRAEKAMRGDADVWKFTIGGRGLELLPIWC